jgi:hypothetical protein
LTLISSKTSPDFGATPLSVHNERRSVGFYQASQFRKPLPSPKDHQIAVLRILFGRRKLILKVNSSYGLGACRWTRWSPEGVASFGGRNHKVMSNSESLSPAGGRWPRGQMRFAFRGRGSVSLQSLGRWRISRLMRGHGLCDLGNVLSRRLFVIAAKAVWCVRQCTGSHQHHSEFCHRRY